MRVAYRARNRTQLASWQGMADEGISMHAPIHVKVVFCPLFF